MSVQTYGLGSECVNDTSLVRSSLSARLARRQEYRAQAGQPPTLLDAVDTGEGWFNHSQILQFDHNSGDR